MTQDAADRPECSVVVPAYNAASTIAATLASVFDQTLRNIEIIVVDDGSRDQTREIVRRLAETEPRLHLLAQSNCGVSAARNAGILRARARILAFLDADDLWPQHHLETHLRRLRADHRLALSFSVARYVDAEGHVVGAARPMLQGHTLRDLVMANPTTTVSTWVARRSAFTRAGLFDVTLRRCEDQEWLVRAALHGLALGGTAESIVDYRTSAGGLASDLDGMRRGYGAMLDRLTTLGGAAIARHRRIALASCDRYLTRRALQLGVPGDVAWSYIVSALTAAPSLLLRQPRSTLRALFAAYRASREAARRPVAAQLGA